MQTVKSIKSYWDMNSGHGMISYLGEHGGEIFSQGAGSLEQIAAMQTLVSSMPVWFDFENQKLYFGSKEVTELKVAAT